MHFVDHGGPADGPLLVCVHGLGGSLLNWAALAPLLTPTCRVLALDLAGFGRTQGGADPTSVEANQHLLHRFLTEVAGTPAILVGNSMGGLIAAMQASAHPETVAGLVLVDPALPTGHPCAAAPAGRLRLRPVRRAAARPGAAQRRAGARAPPSSPPWTCCGCAAPTPAGCRRRCCASTSSWRRSGTATPTSTREFLMAARSLLAAAVPRPRATGRCSAASPRRCCCCTATRTASCRSRPRARPPPRIPAWRFEVAEGVGHVPQLEVPEWTAGHVLDWLAAEGATARDRARHPTLG